MASSQLAITNLALTMLGDRPLSSLAVVSLAAQVCGQMYEGAVQTALSRGPWRFADKKVTLSQLVGVPLNEWQYAYQIPSDNCRVNRVYPDSQYEIYGDQIYSNHSSLAMDYEARTVGLEAIMPSYFERYAAHELLVLIASTLTSDDSKLANAEQWRAQSLSMAMTIDAQQRPNRTFKHSPFVDVRHRSSGF